MYKNYIANEGAITRPLFKVFIMLKFIIVLLILCSTQLNANIKAQNINLNMKSAYLKEAITIIGKQSGYHFLYLEDDLKVIGKVSIKLKNSDIKTALYEVLLKNGLEYSVSGNRILIEKSKHSKSRMSNTKDIIEQQKKVQGKVMDKNGQPLAGVTIRSSSGESTSSNGLGEFSISCRKADKLTLEFLGYENYSLVVGDGNNYQVTMVETIDQLDEVVVVGYGTQKRSSLSGAITEVKGEELTRRPVSSVQQALQGQTSGLTVLDIGGAPGKNNPTMRVRGVTTIGNNNPLVIVDGIEQSMNYLNPNDIETISLLKDAASTAIYGSRAANGVLLVTTKRAKDSGKIDFQYDGFYALQSAINKPEHMDVRKYMEMQNQAYINVGSKAKYTTEDIDNYVNTTDRLKYPLPNTWFDTMFKSAPQINNNIAVSGGNEQLRGRFSFRQQDQQGIIKNMDAQLYDFRTNIDFNILENIKLSSDLNYRYSKNRGPADQFNVFNIMLHASQWTVPQYPDGTYGVSPQGRSPMVENELGGYNRQAEDFILGNFKAEWKIIDGLTATGQFGMRNMLAASKNYLNKYEVRDYYDPTLIRVNVPINNLTETRGSIKEYTFNGLVNYQKKLGDIHDINALLGYSQIQNKTNNINAFRQVFYNNDIQSIGQGANDATKNNGGGDTEWALQSYFGRVNYGYANKYLFEANGRFDGSSRFTGDKTYSFFPSFSAAWRLSQENFWASLSDAVQEFKIRGSWGKVGNQAVDLYSYYTTLNVVNYAFGDKPAAGYTQSKIADPNITWETTIQSNIGFESSFWRNRLTLGIDYYKKRTEGILLVLPIPGVMGLTPSAQNAGVVENKGFEFVVGYRQEVNDWRYNGNLNFNINKNKVVNLAGTGPYISGSNVEPMFITGEGYPISGFWGYQTAGLFQSAEELGSYPKIGTSTQMGDVKYIDSDGNGTINADDMTFLGNSFPTYTYGASLSVGYKNFDLNVLFQGAADVSTRLSGALAEMGNQEGFTHKIYTDNYWTPENTNARFPRPTKFNLLNIQSSDRMLIDGSYLRMKNIQLQYSIPNSWLGNSKLKNIKCYVSGTNLLTFSKLNEWNLDPETPPGRANYYPQTALYTFGVKLGL
ncbi:TonB-linked outer membrane protein, SusC/RagA family [Sphingobacterium nematocida]|uniref:TonB-linked outer membrane protein, SusC/RagA family n=2 Tax=Sphingobacterium nematocida TaxID=1513896 RepID=A0A1T5FLK0_9SPHI|nr:TonB-linked outer membrane protein, SusC/RagA family [Sphingobacterium nematocida]